MIYGNLACVPLCGGCTRYLNYDMRLSSLNNLHIQTKVLSAC